MFASKNRRMGLLAAAVGLSLIASACGSDGDNATNSSQAVPAASGSSSAPAGGGGEAGGGLPAEVKVLVSNPTTGPIALSGIGAVRGYELAVKEINESKFLGDTKIVLDIRDTGGKNQTAASDVSQAAADASYSAIFGAVQSDSAQAQAPIAQKGKIPIIFTQAGTNGVVIGDFTHRLTPLMSDYYPIISDYIAEQGWKSMAVIYTAATPTLVDIGEKSIPAIAEDLGIKMTGSVATQATTQDFSAPISQILRGKPDGVAVLLLGAQNPTAMTQLRQAGYTGPVIGNSAACCGVLDPGGDASSGMVWPVTYSYLDERPASKDFVEKFRAAYDDDPLHNSAETYDAAWLLANALKKADSADRQAIEDALVEIEAEPWTGVLGDDLEFVDRNLAVPGVVIQHNADGEKFLYAAADVK